MSSSTPGSQAQGQNFNPFPAGAPKFPDNAYGPRFEINHVKAYKLETSLDQTVSIILGTLLRDERQVGLADRPQIGFHAQNFLENAEEKIRIGKATLTEFRDLQVAKVDSKVKQQSGPYHHTQWIRNEHDRLEKDAKTKASRERRRLTAPFNDWQERNKALRNNIARGRKDELEALARNDPNATEEEKQRIRDTWADREKAGVKGLGLMPERPSFDEKKYSDNLRRDTALFKDDPFLQKPPTTMPILNCATVFKETTRPLSIAYTIDKIGDLVDAADQGLGSAQMTLLKLIRKFRAANIAIDKTRMKPEDVNYKKVKIASVGLFELSLWLVLNSDEYLGKLDEATWRGPNAVFELLPSWARDGSWRDVDPRADVPKDISKCTSHIVCICSGVLNVCRPSSSPDDPPKLDRLHHFYVGATLQKFESWKVLQDKLEKQREAYVQGDRPAWQALMRNVNNLETSHLQGRFDDVSDDIDRAKLSSPQKKELLALRHKMYDEHLTQEQWDILQKDIPDDSIQKDEPNKTNAKDDKNAAGPKKPPIRDGLRTHIVQSYQDTGDNMGRLVLVQACFSCKLSLRQKEAIDLTENGVLDGQLRHFDTAARLVNATSCAEVPMSKFCAMAHRDDVDRPL
ncbi:hypothetical protein CcaCcLH18_04966 [Colletotrichum camelliae]|nr:hypothetical protein CcaCcLH18_04966 [Colletotrichum camelliae]